MANSMGAVLWLVKYSRHNYLNEYTVLPLPSGGSSMDDGLRFALLGLGLGALYALTAHGIVLVYRGSGVLNFAHGAIGMAGASVQWELATPHRVPHRPPSTACLTGPPPRAACSPPRCWACSPTCWCSARCAERPRWPGWSAPWRS